MVHRRDVRSAVQLAKKGAPFDAVRWMLLTSLRREGELDVNVAGHDIVVRTASPDLRVALSCFGGEFAELFSKVPSLRHKLIVDAGGYIGTAAIVFAEAYPDAIIASLEPSKENFRLLRRNVANYPNIVPINKALAPDDGNLSLKNRGTGQWGFTVVTSPRDNPTSEVIEEVECITLERVMRQFGADGIGVLKLDIEGGEYALLSENTDWIAQTDAICIELHDRIIAGCTDLYTSKTSARVNTALEGEKFLSLHADL